jgi:DNA adenine methylase
LTTLFGSTTTDAHTIPAISTVAPWFGGKRTLGPKIVSLMRPHRCYWEPFVGGITIPLIKPPATMETINDLHGEVTNLARVLASPAHKDQLYTRLQCTLMSQQLHREAAERWKARGLVPAPPEPDLERAYDYFLCCWLGRNGVAGTESYHQGFCVRYTANGGHAAKRFRSAVESIFEWHERLRNVTILNECGFKLLDRIEDEPKTVIYLDPPYVQKGATYQYDFVLASSLDPLTTVRRDDGVVTDRKSKILPLHENLVVLANRFRQAQVIVSYYDHPLVRELYTGWRFIECPMTKALVSSGQRGKAGATLAPEVLLVNDGGSS